MQHEFYIFLIIIGVGFAIYRRVRRNIGWQPLNSRRIWFRVILFGLIGLLLLSSSLSNPVAYISDAVGIILGLILAYFAIKTIQFEQRDKKWFYRSNGWIGVILITLVLGRIIYRITVSYGTYETLLNGTPASQQPPDFSTYTSHPITAGIIFILVAYYACYYIFLIRKKDDLGQGIHE